jgi:hypothetical protein
MAGRTDGAALAAIAAGALLTYAGISGKSIPKAVQAIILGKSPATAPVSEPISSPLGASSSAAAAGNSIYTTSGTVGDVKAGASEQDYFSAVLKDLSAPVTQANLQAFYNWAAKEEPGFPPPTAWTWNPLNIGGPGNFSSWPTPQAGAFGTAGFLLSNNYGAIVSSLRTGNGIVDSSAVAAELLAWSGGGYSSVNSGGG